MGTAFGKLLAATPDDATKARLYAEFGTEPMTMAEVIAMRVILAAAKGSVAAVREIRAATESDMLHFADMRNEQILKRLEESGVESLPDLTGL